MQKRWAARLRPAADCDYTCEASRIFHETLTRRQFMTEWLCGRFNRERRRRIKAERYRRLGLDVPKNRERARGFAGFYFSEDDRFIRQDRAREFGQAPRIDMLPKQLDENPARDRTC